MANHEHLEILMQGVGAWNMWRERHTNILFPDLTGADLRGASLSGANFMATSLSNAILTEADLRGANLTLAQLLEADLHSANLSGADLTHANLTAANLTGANLSRAEFLGAGLIRANLTGANLSGAKLGMASLIYTNLTDAILTDCSVYGISAWDVQLDRARQENLVITHGKQPTITVDNLKVAQFIYLLLNNQEIREVIDTITSKVVLILGRFTAERKIVLDAIRDELRKRNYSPVLFDFEKPANRDLTETISTLAHLARFIIVDLTDPSSAPHEVATIIPHCIVPIQPLLLHDEAKPRHEYAMFQDLRARYHWVLPTYQYQNISGLLTSLKENIIDPAEQKAQELAKR